jgi:hypothetical protein
VGIQRLNASRQTQCVALSGDGATLDLFVLLYHGTDELQELGLPDTRRQFKLAAGFLRRASEGFHGIIEEANPAYQAARQVNEAKDSLATVRLFFLTDGIVRSLELERNPSANWRFGMCFGTLIN